MPRPSIGQLEALVAVADHRSVTAAADELGLSQPSLTRRLQALEETLCIALLRPAGRGVELTPAGLEAVAAARRALTEVSVIDALSESVRTLATGSLRLTGLPSLVSTIAPTFVAPFHREHPGVSISMTTEEDAASVVEALRTGRADLALCVLDSVPSDLVSIELSSQRFIAVVHRDMAHRGLSELLNSATLVTLPTGTSMRTMAEQVYRDLGSSPARVLTTTQRDSLVALALDVRGITIVPDAFTGLAAALGGRCIELGSQRSRPVGVLHTEDALRNPALRTLLDLARA